MAPSLSLDGNSGQTFKPIVSWVPKLPKPVVSGNLSEMYNTLHQEINTATHSIKRNDFSKSYKSGCILDNVLL